MSDNLISVRQLADELGVSKTAVNKKIETIGLRSELVKIDNRFMIPQNVAISVKNAFKNANQSQTKSQTKTPTKSQTKSHIMAYEIELLNMQLSEKNKQIDELRKTIEIISAQLDIKDKQIADENALLTATLEKLDHEQQLNALNQNRILELEDKQNGVFTPLWRRKTKKS